jgi:hypothetical protein
MILSGSDDSLLTSEFQLYYEYCIIVCHAVVNFVYVVKVGHYILLSAKLFITG